MAKKTDIRLRRSNVANAIPGAANLSDGELAMNTMDGALYFKKSDNTIITAHDNTIMHIDSQNNRIGINKTNPNYRLDVSGNIRATGAYIDGFIYHTGDTDTYINYSTDNIILSAGAQQYYFKGNGHVGLKENDPQQALHISDENPFIRIQESDVTLGYADIGYNSGRLRIRSRANTANAGISFEGNNGTTTVEYGRFNSAGNLGIGTNNPTEPLHIKNSDAKIKLEDSDGTNQVGTIFQAGAMLAFQSRNDTANGTIKFQGYNGTTGQEFARFNASGNFGIGTTGPSHRLTVQSDNNTTAVGIDIGSNASYNFAANSTSGYVTTFNMDNTGLEIGHNSASRNLALQTNGLDRLTIGGSGHTTIHNNLEVEGADVTVTGNIKHAGDTDTYFGFHGNDLWRVVTGGSERFEVSNSEIIINDGGSDYDFRVESDNKNHAFFIRGSDGNVGIGTSAPTESLHVAGGARFNSLIKLYTNAGSTYGVSEALRIDNAGANTDRQFQIYETLHSGVREHIISYNTDITTDGSSAYTYTQGNYGGSSAIRFGNSGQIQFFSDAQVSSNSTDTFTPTEVVRFAQNGRVGIGVTAPGSPLDVKSNSVSTQDSGFRLISNQGGNPVVKIGEKGNDKGRFHMFSGTTEKIAFYADGTNNHISAGNLGIGTSSPARKFTVQGGSGDNLPVRIIGGSGTSHGSMEFQDPNTTADYKVTIGSKTDDFYIQAGGSEKVRVKSGGFVGIGTNSPNTNLHISETSNGTSPQLRITNDNSESISMGVVRSVAGTAPDTTFIQFDNSLRFIGQSGTTNELMRIVESGNVGIGQSSPGGKLHVAGASTSPQIIVENTSTTGGHNAKIQFKPGSARNASPYIMSTQRGTSANDGDIQIGDENGTIATFNFGRVGIGTISPASPLDVISDSSALGIRVRGRSSDDIGQIDLANNSGTIRSQLQWNNSFFNIKALAAIPMIFYTNATERMRIQSAGQVGIGIATPLDKLHIYDGDLGIENSSGRRFRLIAETSGGFTIRDQTASAGRIAIDTSGKITFNSAFTFPNSIGSAGQVLKVPSTGTELIWGSASGGGSGSSLEDNDGDTKIQLEESADEDVIRFDIAGTEQMQLNSSGLTVAGNLTVNGTQTILNTSTLTVDDLNITVADGAANAAAANGAGLTVDGANATLLYKSSGDKFSFNKTLEINSRIETNTMNNIGNTANIIYRSSTNTIVGNNASALVVQDGGNVGIGTTSPTQKLSVNGNISLGDGHLIGDDASDNLVINSSSAESILLGSNQHIFFNTGATSLTSQGTTRMFINASGNVGVGTSSPAGNLHIKSIGNVGDALLIVEADADNNVESDNPRIELRQDNNLVAGAIYMEGNAGGTATGTIDNSFVFDSKANTGDNGSPIHFATGGLAPNQSGGPTNSTVRMTIHEQGNIGIGTNAPVEKLDVRGHVSFGDTGGAVSTNYNVSSYAVFKVGGSEHYRLDGTGLIVKTRADNSVSQGLVIERSINSDRGYINYNGGGFQFRSTVGDPIVFGETDAEHVRIQPDGNVGIGTASPNAKLEIRSDGSAAGGAEIRLQHANNNTNDVVSTVNFANNAGSVAMIQGGTSGANNTGYISLHTDNAGTSSEKMRINGAGDVGIGTTTPQGKLDVDGDLRITRNIVSNTVYQMLSLGSDRTINDYGGVNKDYWRLNLATPGASTDGGSSAHAYGTLIFSGVTGSNTTYADRLAITAGGNVGIGTNTPSQKLDVAGNTTSNAYILRTNGSAPTADAAIFRAADNTLAFSTGSSEKMRIDASGDVGIGTQDPDAKLHVRGSQIVGEAGDSDQGPLFFEWVKSNTGSTGSGVWYKVANISLPNQGYSAIAFSATYVTGINNYGNHDYIRRYENFITIVRNSGATANNSPDTATVRGVTDDIRVYKTATGTYELQARGNSANMEYHVEVKVFQGGANRITPVMAGDTAGTTSGGTAFTLNAMVNGLDGIIRHSGVTNSKYFNASNGSSSSPSITFEEDTDTGFFKSANGSNEQVNVVTDGGTRGYFNSAGITSNSNVYTSSTGAFRNYGGVWNATTGIAGNGFYFLNTANSNTVKALEISSTGALTHRSNYIQTAGSWTKQGTNGNVTIASNGNELAFSRNGTNYIDAPAASGNFAIRTGTSYATRMVISNAGNVGIGASSPQESLHTTGNIRLGDSAPAELYTNSSELRLGVDRNNDNGTSNITFYTNNDEKVRIDATGNVGIGTTNPKAKFQVEEYGIDTSSSTTTATTQTVIHTFPIADFRTARFTIQITNTTDSTYHSTEIIAVHDGSTANITEFGEVHTGSSVEATFDSDVNSGNFRLLATPSSTDSMTFKVVCHSITV